MGTPQSISSQKGDDTRTSSTGGPGQMMITNKKLGKAFGAQKYSVGAPGEDASLMNFTEST
jgi:hypothetical protein